MLTIYPDDHFSVEVMVEYNFQVLPNQFAVLDDLSEFKQEGCKRAHICVCQRNRDSSSSTVLSRVETSTMQS